MRKRWSTKDGNFLEVPRADALIAEIIEVCKRHGLAISHEDGHGAFEIEPYDDFYAEWLHSAHWNGGPNHGLAE